MSKDKLDDGYYKIRPAARLIHTIGKDLIGDPYAAVVELVKNSYDADAPTVDVIFHYKEIDQQPALVIIVKDTGHGMGFDTVINKWLVPATNDKLKTESSPKGRILQGKKGIGRFASSILGQEMTLSTIDDLGKKTTAIIDWRIFDSDEYLENIKLLVEEETTNKESGTYIEIIAKDEKKFKLIDGVKKEVEDFRLSYWTEQNINTLEQELRKLISPFQEYSKDKFDLNLSFTNCPFPQYNNREFKIEAYPIIQLYDYRISGTIDGIGKTVLTYENNVDKVKQTEVIKIDFKIEKENNYCGKIKIDFRVFDRESEAIENLINKGLIDPISEKYVGKREARRLLNEAYGINIYRKDFRIRPYGNGGIDWLDLDKDRIQNFTLRISNNQVIGFVTIESEGKSFLEEKSARDGLKENSHYFGLKELCKKALSELELRRLTYRVKTKKSRRITIKKNLEHLFNYSTLENSIKKKLTALNVNKEKIQQIEAIIKQEEEQKAKLLEEIQKTIAVYQGQATLGKILSYIFHEGRKSIHYFRNEIPLIKRNLSSYRKSREESIYQDITSSINGFEKHSASLSDLFKRLNPLASQRRGKRKNFSAKQAINDAIHIFKTTLKNKNISIIVNCKDDVFLYGWQNDLTITLANLIENSIYWLEEGKTKNKSIEINTKRNKEGILITYQDNGPGLTEDEIKSEIIFEPGYSKKLNGTGLGLAIAGEAVERLNGKLMARENKNGAYFQIEINKNE